MREYVLTEDQLRSLARGLGDTGAVALLADAQLSRRRLMLLDAAGRAPDSPDLRAALTLVMAIDREAPQAGRELLRHPFLETWLGEADGSYLGALAAATAVHAGLPFELTLRVTAPDLVLPGLGTALDVGEGPLTLRFDGSVLSAGAAQNWRPAFHVRLPSVTVELDDADPLRDRFSQPPIERMPDEERAAFGRALTEAWELLEAEQPEQTAGMSHTLHSLVPLMPPADGSQVSASVRDCFGAIGMAPTDDPAVIAELLLHESRHEVLDALLDLVELCEPGGPARYHAPWRPDARPVEALIQGVYAFAGVTQFWSEHRRHLSGEDARTAEFTFAYWREQVSHALDQVLESGELTDLGEVFFGEIASVLADWREDSEAAEAAWMSAVAARVAWRLAHHEVDHSQIETFARAWSAGEPPPRPGEPSIIEGAAPGMELSERIRRQWLAGDAAEALTVETGDWVAVVTALTINGKDEDAIAYRRPEILRALAEQVGRAPDVVALARWLGR